MYTVYPNKAKDIYGLYQLCLSISTGYDHVGDKFRDFHDILRKFMTS